MKATIWGCRGSVASPGADKITYGGDTSCVEIRLEDGTLIILDAGTGICSLSAAVTAPPSGEIHLLLTHLHMDHVEGFPFFPLLWQPGTTLHVWGPPSPLMTLKERIARYMSPPLFPIDVHDVPSECTFHDLPLDTWSIGSAKILALPIEHPGPTVGFRIEENGRSIAYMPDHEPAALGDFASESPDWIDGFAIAHDVDVLLHDSQYTPDQYESKRGWGHSSYADAVAYAKVTGARQLYLFHHDPTHTDPDLEALLAAAVKVWGPDGNPPKLAASGLTIDLSKKAATVG